MSDIYDAPLWDVFTSDPLMRLPNHAAQAHGGAAGAGPAQGHGGAAGAGPAQGHGGAADKGQDQHLSLCMAQVCHLRGWAPAAHCRCSAT